MSRSVLPKGFLSASGYLIPRVSDQVSYAYVQAARISQDDTGVLLTVGQEVGAPASESRISAEDPASFSGTVYLPTAMLACLLIGPGATITHRAVTTLARHGTTLVWVGAQGVRCYASANAPASTTLLTLAAQVCSDPSMRLAAARRMYSVRFGEQPPEEYSLAQLRGMEGARVRATYQALAKHHRVRFKRSYERDDFESADPVNRALSSANACLYGIVAAALSSLGVPHGLGIIHSGHPQALVYDIADLYKAEVTIPAAFAVAKESDPESAVRRAFREKLTMTRLLPRLVADIRFTLGEVDKRTVVDELRRTDLVSLWDGGTDVPGGSNYADPAGTEQW